MSSHTREADELHDSELSDRDLLMLDAFSRRSAYWTTDLALIAGHDTAKDAYRALERMEERHLVRRVVRMDPTSWRRTELGGLIADTFGPSQIRRRIC